MRRRAGLALLVLALAFTPVEAAFAQASPPITLPGYDDVRGTAENTGSSIGAVLTGGGRGSGGSGSAGGGRQSRESTSGGSGGGGARRTGGTAPPPCGREGQEPCPATPGLSSGKMTRACGPIDLAGFEGQTAPPSEQCRPSSGSTPAPPDPAQMARSIAQRTPLPVPAVRTSPPAGEDQLVNLPTWLWVEDWSPRSARASEGPLTVTVVATPRSVTWRMGDGSEVVCGAGTPRNPALREEQQSTDCSHTYRRSSATQPGLLYQARATMTWDVSWSATNGESGGLGPATRSVDFTMRVAEGQALVTASGL